MCLAAIASVWKSLNFTLRHPLNRADPWQAVAAFMRWQVGSRLVPGPVLLSLVDDTKIFARPGLNGATGAAYVGLQEFEDMAFVLHLLRPGEHFVDVGANVGSYSLLAAGGAGARVTAFEPAPNALRWLHLNLAVNNLEGRVVVHPVALGRMPGQVSFTSGFDTVNHVVSGHQEPTSQEETITVPVRTLDTVMGPEPPTLLKVDVEGFEREVFGGGAALLRTDEVLAVIVEINGSGNRYGHPDADIHQALTSAAFAPYGYDALSRTIIPMADYKREGNTLYLRKPGEVEARVKSARRFRIGRFGEI